MREVSLRALVLKSDEKGIGKFLFDSPFDVLLRTFAKHNKIHPGSTVRLTVQVWEDDCTPRAFNLFHVLRDRLAEVQEDTSKEYKEHLKRCLKFDTGIYEDIAPGVVELKSTLHYTWREMQKLIDFTIMRCLEEKAPIADLLQENIEKET